MGRRPKKGSSKKFNHRKQGIAMMGGRGRVPSGLSKLIIKDDGSPRNASGLSKLTAKDESSHPDHTC